MTSGDAKLSGLARGGLLSLVGSGVAAVLNVGAILVLTRYLGTGRSGALLATVAIFQVVTAVTAMGVDTGLVRAISGRVGRPFDPSSLLKVSLPVVVVVSTAIALLGLAQAGYIADLIGDDRFVEDVVTFVRALAPFLPLAALSVAVLGATRGYGTMLPTVALERVARPLLQVALLAAIAQAALGSRWVAVAWASPYAIVLSGALVWLVVLARTDGTSKTPQPLRRVFGEFWRFTLPRSLATTFRVTLQWLDVVLVAALAGAEDAAIYTVATRLLQFGVLAAFAIGQAIEPRLGAALAVPGTGRARDLYRAATAWQLLVTWPIYIILMIFAPAILALFGAEFAAGATTVLILGVSVMMGAAAGPVDILLLMAGRSRLSLGNTFLSLTTNVMLNFWLIPVLGITGAAVSWAVSRIIGNLLPLGQVSRSLGIDPFGPAWRRAFAVTAGVFAPIGLGAAWIFGSDSLVGALVAASAGLVLYLGVLRHNRQTLHLDVFTSIFTRRAQGGTA